MADVIKYLNKTDNDNGTDVSRVIWSWEKIMTAVILYSITIITIVGNLMVLVAFKIEKRLRTTFNYYIVNLAITDVMVGITAMSFQATYAVLGYWPFGEVVCSIWIFFDYGMTFVSVFTLMLICIDRFWSVRWSINYKTYHTKRKCLVSIISIWCFMLLLWVPPWLVDRVRYSIPGDCFWDPSLNREFVFIVAVLGHHGPYLLMIVCYVQVFYFMRKRIKITDGGTFRIAAASSSRTTNVTALSALPTDCETSVTQSEQPKIASVTPIGANIENQSFSTHHITVSYTRSQNSHAEAVNAGRKMDRQKRERMVFLTLTYVIIGYGILWLPFHVVFDISIINPTFVSDNVLNMAFWMAYVNSTINPLLYNFSSSEFRKVFRQMLCACRCCKPRSS